MLRSKGGKTEDDWLFEFYCGQIRDIGDAGTAYVRRCLMQMDIDGEKARADKLRLRLNAWRQARKKTSK